MCGFYCFVSNKKIPDNVLNKSLGALHNRGPDHKAVKLFKFKDKFLYFGHTRLAIIDLSKNANQPFENDKFILVFNGEIYNHQELREKFCSSYSFKTTSDTETLIALFSCYNSKKFMSEVRGMFAFSIFNKLTGEIESFRDRAGEKPLYISISNDFFALTSDISAAKGLPGFNRNLARESVDAYLQYGNIPYPLCIYESSFKLPPAGALKLNINLAKFSSVSSFEDLFRLSFINFYSWWEFPEIRNLHLSNIDIRNNVHETLKQSVSSQLISDVPIGVFLSGGIDSSLIASLVSQINPQIECFNIGFEFSEYDESSQARNIAQSLGLKFTSLKCTQENALNEIDAITSAYSEPFADSSQIPTMLIAKLARSKATVVLTGDCGDELFGGYNRYLLASKYARFIYLLPKKFKNRLINISDSRIGPYIEKLFNMYFANQFSGNISDRFKKSLMKIAEIDNDLEFYLSMTREWTEETGIKKFNFNDKRFNHFFDNFDHLQGFEKMMLADFHSYMTDDILCKVDRASMHYSLETRVPFLDLDVINAASQINFTDKISREYETKNILKQILLEYLPKNLFDKPKQGFGVPISQWLRNELRDYAHDHCSQSMNERHGYFNQSVVNKILDEHMSGNFNHEHKLWSIIQFNSWYASNS